MAWLKLDDGFAQHPKVFELSDAAFRAHVAALCYAGRFLTDGFLSSAVARGLTVTATPKVLAELVRSGLWEDAAGGYQIHDFLHYNPSRADAEEARAAKQEARRAGGMARARTAVRDHGRFAPTNGTGPGEPPAGPAGDQLPAGFELDQLKPAATSSRPVPSRPEKNGANLVLVSSVSGIVETSEIHPTSSSLARRRTRTLPNEPPAFTRFWDVYPKHKGKQEALDIWLRENPSPGLVERILAAVEWQREQRQWRRDQGEYVPEPARWLRRRRWEDEPPADTSPDMTDALRESLPAFRALLERHRA